jgi:hypothetical protein
VLHISQAYIGKVGTLPAIHIHDLRKTYVVSGREAGALFAGVVTFLPFLNSDSERVGPLFGMGQRKR